MIPFAEVRRERRQEEKKRGQIFLSTRGEACGMGWRWNEEPIGIEKDSISSLYIPFKEEGGGLIKRKGEARSKRRRE